MNDMSQLPGYAPRAPRKLSRWIGLPVSLIAIMACALYFVPPSMLSGKIGTVSVNGGFSLFHESNPDGLCPIVQKVDPRHYVYDFDRVHHILHSEAFRNESVRKLQEAVRVPTQVYDNLVNPNCSETLDELFEGEPRWKPFQDFIRYMEKTFPLAHQRLHVERVNHLGLVYTWEGSDTSKKPILLTAHYDVVPVQQETVPQWTYPPFSAEYDGEYVYGRGASDCKNLLVGLMETFELLLAEDTFRPQRTIVLAFGYDEEAGGTGAENIGQHLLARYGPDSFYQLIDEGNSGTTEIEGNHYILPATGEKGHLDSIVEIYTPGGHSSVPPKHTAIGLLAKLISDIEDHEYQSIITNSNPVLNQLQCVAEHSASVDAALRKTILKAHLDMDANSRLLAYMAQSPADKYLVTTSQAVDVIFGGVKSNALPEHASVLVNQRIALEESVVTTRNKILGQVYTFATQYRLGLVFNGDTLLEKTAAGYLNYTATSAWEPAPVTPVGGKVWDLFGGSLRFLYEDLVNPGSNDTYIFAPYISTGNTDTQFYWDLTRNIYRYEPGLPASNHNIHSIDEKLPFDSHLHVIAFYYYYLQVVDQQADDDAAAGSVFQKT